MAPSIRTLLIGLLPLVSAQGCPYAGVNKRDLLAQGNEPSLVTLDNSFGKCPTLSDAAGGGTRSRDWWPCQLKLDVLRQFSPEQNPLGGSFDYAAAFATLDCKLPQVKGPRAFECFEQLDARGLTQFR
jgi:catalase-peroxidase